MTARVAWLVAIVPFAAAIAHAEPPTAPADPARDQPEPRSREDNDQRARDALERGIAAYHARQFSQAVDELLQANRLAPDRPEPYRWLALAEAEIDDCPSALINIDAFLSRVPPGDPGVPELTRLRGRCLDGKVDVDSAPSGATIRVDGGPAVGATPIKHLAMRVGAHTLTLEKPGFEPLSHRIEVRPLGSEYASFTLTPAREPAASRRWLWWVAIGAAAVVGVGVALSHDSHDAPSTPAPSLPGVTCNSAGCHP